MDSTLDVRVPTYVLRGAGTATHYAYEVRLRVGVECWAILRRYSRFRELHLNMKHKYGAKVFTIKVLFIILLSKTTNIVL